MYRDNNRLVLYRVILALALFSLLYAVHRVSKMSLLILLQPLQQIYNGGFSSTFLLSLILLVILLLTYIKRRKKICVAVTIILIMTSYLCWFSSTAWWAEYNISPRTKNYFNITMDHRDSSTDFKICKEGKKKTFSTSC
jgi:uncharacterized membrane protein (UPF0136 family)